MSKISHQTLAHEIASFIRQQYGEEAVVTMSHNDDTDTQVDVEFEAQDGGIQTFSVLVTDVDAEADEYNEANNLDPVTGEYDVDMRFDGTQGDEGDNRTILGMPIEPNELTLADLLAEDDDTQE